MDLTIKNDYSKLEYYNNMHHITNGIFLGALSAAQDENNLKINNITNILSLVETNKKFDVVNYLEYNNINDDLNQNIFKYFHPCFLFIDKALSNKENILIHCYAGISRSSTILIAYLMYRFKLSFNDAYIKVKSERVFIKPNNSFVEQLKIFENMDEKLKWFIYG